MALNQVLYEKATYHESQVSRKEIYMRELCGGNLDHSSWY